MAHKFHPQNNRSALTSDCRVSETRIQPPPGELRHLAQLPFLDRGYVAKNGALRCLPLRGLSRPGIIHQTGRELVSRNRSTRPGYIRGLSVYSDSIRARVAVEQTRAMLSLLLSRCVGMYTVVRLGKLLCETASKMPPDSALSEHPIHPTERLSGRGSRKNGTLVG
jgi:hypothetical protein